MQGALTIALIQFFIHNPKWIWVVSLFGIVISGLIGYTSYKDLRTMPLQPEHLSLEEIIGKLNTSRLWVTVDGAQWDCQNIVMDYKDFGNTVNHTYIAFTNKDHTIVGMATFSYKQTCEELKSKDPAGVISEMNEKMKASFIKKGVNLAKYPTASKFLDLCTFCGRNNSTLGLFCAPAMFILSLVLPLMLKSSVKKGGIIIYG